MKQLLTKTLLVAVGLLVGQSAWGQVSTWTASSGTYTKGQEITGNTPGVITMTLGQDDNWAWHSGRGGIYANTQQAPTLTDGIPTAGGYIIITPARTLQLSMQTYSSQSNCNVYMYEGTTKKKDFRQKGYNTNDYGMLEAGKTYYIYGGSFKQTGDLEYVFFKDFTATTYETYTIHYVDDSATPVTIKEDRVVSNASLYGATVSAVESDLENIIYMGETYAYKSGNTPITLKTSGNDITLVFAKATAASYKIRYKAEISSELTDIKDEATIESAVGATVSATGANFPTYITYNDIKYKYSSGNEPLTVTGNTENDVITLTYTPAPIYDYEVNAYNNTPAKLGPITSGSYVEGDDAITVAYPQYYLSGTTLYNIPSNGSGDYFRTTFTPNEDDYEVKLTYSGSSVSDVVYYSEIEKLENVTKVNYLNRASNGQVAHTGSAETFVATTTLDVGKYKIYYRALNGSNNEANRLSVVFKSGDQVVYSRDDIGANTNFTDNSDEFVVSSNDVALTMACKGHGTAGVDWIYVVKTGERFYVGEDIITNGSFATNTDGWTLDNYKRNPTAGQNSTPVVESWNNAGRDAGSVTQSVGYLPTGNYVISASVLSGAEAYLKVLNASDDSEIASIECTGSWYDKTVAKSFTLNEVKDVKVQFSTPAQAEGTWWSYVTNVSLIYYGSNTPVESKMAVSAPNKAKYGTFYAPYDVEIPTLIKAYTAQNNAAGTALTLTEITGGTIPAYTPVILENNRSNDNTFNGTFYGLTADGSTASSALSGTLDEYTLQDGEYIMQYQNNETAFYSVAGAAIGKKIAANRCYIAASQTAKGVNVIYLGSETTAINNANAAEASKPAKRIVNGQLVIEKNGKQYNAIGQEK